MTGPQGHGSARPAEAIRPQDAPERPGGEPGRPVLEVQGLRKHFRAPRSRGGGVIHAVEDVDLTIGPGEIVGLVGESGCGKSTVGRCIVRLADPDRGRITLDGTDITGLSRRQLRPHRRKMHMVFQDPYSSLNPRMRVEGIVSGPLRAQGHPGPAAAVAQLLDQVGLPAQLARRYPHELSGGQRQRVGLARSLAARRLLLVADEPTSALDVSVQASILNQLSDLHDALGFACLFISHDLAVVEYLCDRIAVMYLGRIVEIGTRDEIFAAPKHPYTQALLAAALDADPGRPARPPVVLAGEPPSPRDPPGGCPFHPRCPVAVLPLCRDETPPTVTVPPGDHWARCHLVGADGSAPDAAAAASSG